MIALPSPRGALSAQLVESLAREPHAIAPAHTLPVTDVLADEDLQLALYCCYELHYRGLPGVDERWEWEPSLIAWRRALEERLEAALLEALGRPESLVGRHEIDLELRAIAENAEGPGLSHHLERKGTLDQFREFAIHRSAYQLKEADPHSWAIPRLSGAPKAALVEVQADEYGGGRPERMHSALFARSMRALGLDARYGAHLDRIPGLTLATVNVMSLFGLHRRLRGALVGHLALFEMTSSIPNARYARGLRRLGLGEEATAFFDEHVEADAVHEQIACVDLAGGLARAEPGLAGDILWGARALGLLEDRWAERLLDAWATGGTSLLEPIAGAPAEVAA